ncbi:MAG: OmpA/MotB family protein [Pseudonocardiaceae bacterium]
MTDKSTLPAELDSLAQELTLARATELARTGHYSTAERLLADPEEAVPMPPAHLDLLARIQAQQGKLAEADTHWARAATISGDTGAYQAQRQRIATLQQQRFSTSRTLRWIGFTVAAVVALVLLWPREGVDGIARSDIQAVQANQDELARQLSEHDRRIVEDSEPLLSSIAAELSSPTVLVRPVPGALAVSFTTALFQGGGAELTPEGDAALADLGRRLAPHAAALSVKVVGHTEDATVEPGGQYRNNATLAFGRAQAAVERLSATSGIPRQGFAVHGAGRDDPPFPNTSPEDRLKNRTVTLTITPARP